MSKPESNEDCACGNPLESGQTRCAACRAEQLDDDHGDFLADAESDEMGGEA